MQYEEYYKNWMDSPLDRALSPFQSQKLFVTASLSVPPLMEPAAWVEPLGRVHSVHRAADVAVGVPVLWHSPHSIESIVGGPPEVFLTERVKSRITTMLNKENLKENKPHIR